MLYLENTVNSSIDWQVKAGEIIGLHHGLLESSGETERRVVEFHVCNLTKATHSSIREEAARSNSINGQQKIK